MDRRTTLKWMLAAGSTLPLASLVGCGEPPPPPRIEPTGEGYGTDPDLLKSYAPGQLWPLILSPEQRRLATALCDLILPGEPGSPGAVAVGVVDFLDEWVSAPYPQQSRDRKLVLDGFDWLDADARRRYSRIFVRLDTTQRRAICDDIRYLPNASAAMREGAGFFARFRDLVLGGFATSPEGRHYLGYVGNTPLPQFDGPPPEVLRLVGLE